MTSISSLWIKTHAPKGKIFVLSSNSSLVENLSCIEVDRSTTDRFVLQILQKENGWYVLSSIKILTVPSYSWLSILLLLFLSSVTFGKEIASGTVMLNQNLDMPTLEISPNRWMKRLWKYTDGACQLILYSIYAKNTAFFLTLFKTC